MKYNVHVRPPFVLQIGETQYVANAVDAKTRASWTVQAESRYEAVVELARQVGFELEE